MQTCSVVIRAFNEEKHLGRLLDGLEKQTLRNPQVILVDSGSTDSTVEIAQHYGVEIVSIRPEEFSFGRSLNLGMEKTKNNQVVVCSAHVYPVYPDWLEKLIEPLSNPKVALTYGKQRGTDQSHFSEQQLFKHWYPDQNDLRQSHPFCNNANAAIQRVLWENHPYHENIPALEDLAWAKWAHDQGYGIAYVSEAEVIHVHHETWRGVFNRYRREGMAFKQIYPHENFNTWDMFHTFTQNVLSDFRVAREQKKIQTNRMDILHFRWMQSRGTFAGYHQSGPLTWQLKKSFYYPRSLDVSGAVDFERKVSPIDYSSHQGGEI
jgi:rhamnosyltransferase